MSEGPRRLAAIMFTDMVGYTALGQANESLSLALVEEQRKVVRPVLSKHNGREVKTMGDAFLVEFPNAVDAVRCAYDIQRVVREFDLSLDPDRRIHLRVGLHVGEVVESEGDISGDAVNIASRIEPLAVGGGVCVTRQVYDLVKGKVDIQLSSMGLKPLKNVVEQMEVYRMVMPWEAESPSPSTRLDPRRIAVLPFANMSPDPNDGYFADGMTEELITSLSGVGGLTVVARTSVMKYKGTSKGAAEIAKDLNAGTLIEGSIRKAGNRLRVTVQVIDGKTESHSWAQNYDREFDDIFAIQSDIASKVADSVRGGSLPVRKESPKPTASIEAYTLYLKGLAHAQAVTEEDSRLAIRYLQQAVDIDPKFAQGYAAMANSYIAIGGEFMSPETAFAQAKRNVTKALELDNNLGDAWVAHGNLCFQHDWDFEASEQSLKRALELNPNSAEAYHWYAVLTLVLRRFDEALGLAERGVYLDPFSADMRYIQALANALANRRSDALLECSAFKKLFPDSLATLVVASLVYAQLGMIQEAKSEFDLAFERAHALSQQARGWTGGTSNWMYSTNAFIFAKAGESEKIKLMLADAERETGYVDPTAIGFLHLALGEKEEGYSHVEKAVEQRDPGILFQWIWWNCDDLRNERRFVDLLRKVGVPESSITK